MHASRLIYLLDLRAQAKKKTAETYLIAVLDALKGDTSRSCLCTSNGLAGDAALGSKHACVLAILVSEDGMLCLRKGVQ